MRLDSSISQTTPGAGRVFDMSWPNHSTNFDGTTARRYGVPESNVSAALIGTQGNGTLNTYRGRVNRSILSTAAGNGAEYYYSNPPFGGPIDHPVAAFTSDFAVFSIRCVFASVTPTASLRAFDFGITLVAADRQLVFGNTAAGVMWGPTAQGEVGWRMRYANGGALVQEEYYTPAGFDCRDWHKYEIRVVTSTNPNSEGWVVGYLDGVQITTKVPIDSVTAKFISPFNNSQQGYSCVMVNFSQNNCPTMYLNRFQVLMAATEQALE